AGGIADPPYSEDLMDACYKNDPPEVVCNFIRTTCMKGELSGVGSSDDGEIVEYAWDFDNDGDYDAYGETVSYNIVGTHEVRLMVTDDLGQTANCTLTATVTPDPDAVLKADGGDGPVNLPVGGKTVTFDGTGSSAVLPAVIDESLCNLVIPGAGTYTGLGPWDVNLDLPCGTSITATLTVVDNFGCETQDTVEIRGPVCAIPTPTPPPSEVPTSTPVGIVALVGLLGIAGGIRLLNRGKRS
ncbi:MAG: PKD domain-containing protein, partial [Euryarchaeota archaeon]|nr:PKD domain-containing protein [Euryarchaeota archaeon]